MFISLLYLYLTVNVNALSYTNNNDNNKKSKDQNLVRFLFHEMLLICLANGHRLHHHSFIQIKEMNKISRIMFAIDTKMPLKVDQCEMRRSNEMN